MNKGSCTVLTFGIKALGQPVLPKHNIHPLPMPTYEEASFLGAGLAVDSQGLQRRKSEHRGHTWHSTCVLEPGELSSRTSAANVYDLDRTAWDRVGLFVK
jgi:hypothetical protein